MADDDTKDDITTDDAAVDASLDDMTTEDAVTEDAPAEVVEEKVEDVKEPEVAEPLQDSSEPQSASSEPEEKEDGGYQFDDDLSSVEPSETPVKASADGGGSGKYADEIFSKTIHAKFRTFYVDLKESSNGKFIKVSEKSRGRKSTIMMDEEDLPAMIEALQEVQKQL